jgi:hypothetical protein
MGEVVLARVILDSEIIYLTLIRSQIHNSEHCYSTNALPNVSLKVWNEALEVAFKYYFLF